MDVLIYGLGNLLTLAILIGGLMLPALLAYWLGKSTPYAALRWVLPVLTLALPLAWAAAGYWTFTRNCASLAKTEFIKSPAERADGFLMIARHVSAVDLIERGAFKYVESPSAKRYQRSSAGPRRDERGPFPVNHEFITESALASRYVVSETEPQPLRRWFMPAIAMHSIEVRERMSGDLLARSSELVFGGGVLGFYMALLGRDQDFQHISCGHVASEVGPWRPTLASRPRHKQYLDADLRFLVTALGVGGSQ